MSQRATFQLDNFIFNEVKLSVNEVKPKEINVDFMPEGVFYLLEKTFDLKLNFIAFESGERENPFIKISCIGTFSFENVDSVEDIPSFFYRNAIAILFPYIRAFISSLTAQANITPMILPTYNLGELEAPLRDKTITL